MTSHHAIWQWRQLWRLVKWLEKCLARGNGKQIWISFKYERLPNLCYWCGRLIHEDKDYEIWIDSEGTLKPKDRQFGLGLRAPAFISTRKTRLTMSGFYTMRRKFEVTTSPSLMDADNPDNSGQMLMKFKEKVQDGGWNRKTGHEASQSSSPNMICNAQLCVTHMIEMQTESMQGNNCGDYSAFKPVFNTNFVTDTP